MSVQRSVRFPDELFAGLQVLVERQERRFSEVVIRVLDRALEEGITGAPRAIPKGVRTSLTDGERRAVEHAREGLDATPFADAVARMPRQRDSVAMERQRRMNEAKGL